MSKVNILRSSVFLVTLLCLIVGEGQIKNFGNPQGHSIIIREWAKIKNTPVKQAPL